MSLLNNNNKKKKGSKGGISQPGKPGLQQAKGKTNTKGVSRNAKLTGGSQRGS
jgi:hypothetical protein